MAVLRPMKDGDLEAVAALSRRTLWPLRADEWGDLARNGLAVVAEAHGQVAGAGVAWRLDEDCAAIGGVLALPGHAGLEARIVAHLLAQLPEASVFVHSAHPAVYEEAGFVFSRRLQQHQGLASMAPLVALDQGDRVRPLGRGDAERLSTLDARASGYPRGQAIRRLLDSGRCVILENEGTAKGYAFCRECGPGFIIGPVAAPSQSGALALMSHWINQAAGRTVRIDVPQDSGLSPWLESIGLTQQRSISTLVRGTPYTPADTPFLWAMLLQSLE